MGVTAFSVYIGGTGTLYLTFVPGECQTLTFIVFQLQLMGLALSMSLPRARDAFRRSQAWEPRARVPGLLLAGLSSPIDSTTL